VTFSFIPTALEGVLIVEHPQFRDERGFFCETFREKVFSEHGIGPFVQENHSRSRRGALRGLHWQKEPAALGKLVRCVRGRIFDVAVDVRSESPTFAQWVGIDLCGDDNRMFWLPPGFAHGFCTLSEVADIVYRQTDYYSPQHECIVRWNDPKICINWPLAQPILSEKDARAPLLSDGDL